MTLKQLEYFLAIAEAGHITAAAKNLNISQPPLSLQLKALEMSLVCSFSSAISGISRSPMRALS